MKKFISMALALVMTLSLCTFVAAPKAEAGFDDADELSSKYAVQAADVIKTIEVMDGYDDNTFRPEAGLTRQAAAKIICNLILGPTTAKALPTNANPFPDVIAGNQFSGYISYCVQQGIISGYADGTFRPGDPLSGYAYLKMLLGALGYDANQEGFVGSNWKVNVAKIALGINLNKGIEEELDGSTQVTREEAAIYAFNTLQADMVEYESKNTLEINGVKVSMGGGNAVPQTWNTSGTSIDNISAARSDGENRRPIVQFAERYFDKLVREPNGYHPARPINDGRYENGRDEYTTDDFGRPAIRWFWKGVEIGTYPRDPDATFIGNVKVNAIYEALRENTGMSSGDDTGRLYINSNVPNKENLKVERANDKDLDHANNLAQDRNAAGDGLGTHTDRDSNTGDTLTHRVDRIGDGTLIEVFRNDANNHVDICVISVYGGKVDAVKGATAKKDAYVTIDWGDVANHRPETINLTGNNEYETEDFDEDDVVAYTYSDSAESIKSMYLMTSEAGALQSKVTTKSLRLDNVTYNYGKEYTFNDLLENNLSNKSSYIVYLDENDYVLWVEEDEFSVDDYVLVERITIETSVDGATTKTASVLGRAVTNSDYQGNNAQALQEAYNQSKDPVGNSSWDAQAQVRYPTGTRRTITLDDSKNYRTSHASDTLTTSTTSTSTTGVVTTTVSNGSNTATVTNTAGTIATTGRVYGNNDNGEGDGNWIAYPYTAGRIVRLSSNSDGYRLHSITDERFEVVSDFSIQRNRIYGNGADIRDLVTINNTPTRVILTADSETHIVVDDVTQGSYKSYYGIKNAPDVSATKTLDNGAVTHTTAYIYHNEGSVKLIYVTNAYEVKNSSNDVVFIAANSRSNLVESDDGKYYEVTAVDKNEVKTLFIKENATLTMIDDDPNTPLVNEELSFTPANRGSDNKTFSVILNNVTYDTNDFITKAHFDTGVGMDRAGVLVGIRRVNDEEVRLNTSAAQSQLKDVAENVRVYFVDGGDIEQIDYADITNDTQDLVYYVENNDGEITYLFIVDYDPVDDAPAAYVPPAVINPGSISFNAAGNVATYHLVSGATTPNLETVRAALNALNPTVYSYSNARTVEGSTDYLYTRTNLSDNSTMEIRVSFAYDATQTQNAA